MQYNLNSIENIILQKDFTLKNNQGQEYQLLEQLGKGSEGIVYKGVIKNTNEIVAIKLEFVSNQMDIMEKFQQVQFNHVLNVRDIIFSNQYIFLVMDCASGEFYKFMETQEYKDKTKEEKNQLFLQVVKGVEEIHRINYIHRDIKPENILYFRQQNDIVLKLCDFGLLKKTTDFRKTPNIGTPYYWAPEMISDQQSAIYSNQVDIWALGMLWYEMIVGSPMLSQFYTVQSIKDHMKHINQEWINQNIDNCQAFNQEEKILFKTKILLVNTYPNQRINASALIEELQLLFNKQSQTSAIINNNKNSASMQALNLQGQQNYQFNVCNVQSRNFIFPQKKEWSSVQQNQPIQVINYPNQVPTFQPNQQSLINQDLQQKINTYSQENEQLKRQIESQSIQLKQAEEGKILAESDNRKYQEQIAQLINQKDQLLSIFSKKEQERDLEINNSKEQIIQKDLKVQQKEADLLNCQQEIQKASQKIDALNNILKQFLEEIPIFSLQISRFLETNIKHIDSQFFRELCQIYTNFILKNQGVCSEKIIAIDELSNQMTEFKKEIDQQHKQLKDIENSMTSYHQEVDQKQNQKKGFLGKANENLTQLNIYFQNLDKILENQKNNQDCPELFLMSQFFYFIKEVNEEILKIEKNNQLIPYDQMKDELKRQGTAKLELSQKYQVIYSGVKSLSILNNRQRNE